MDQLPKLPDEIDAAVLGSTTAALGPGNEFGFTTRGVAGERQHGSYWRFFFPIAGNVSMLSTTFGFGGLGPEIAATAIGPNQYFAMRRMSLLEARAVALRSLEEAERRRDEAASEEPTFLFSDPTTDR